MKKQSRVLVFVLLTIYAGSFQMSAQIKKDTLNKPVKVFKNTIRTNITNPMILGKYYNVIGYERVIRKNQTFSFNIGRFSLPKFSEFTGDSLGLNKDTKDYGFTFAADYRFYLKKENKYRAPRGVYIGPYYSFSSFQRNNSWILNTQVTQGTAETKSSLNLNLFGGQMGYQFIIKNRIAIDLIFFGPGIWFYSVRTSINATLDPNDESLLLQKINELLAAKLPGHEILLKPGEKQTRSSFRLASAGFRYLIHIGFRF